MNYEKLYNIERGNVYRLQKRVDYLESSSYLDSLKSKHEKKLASLNLTISKLERKMTKCQEREERYKQRIKRLVESNHEKDKELEEIKREYEIVIEEYKKMIEELRKDIDEVKKINQKLTAQINRDYTNSSIPSSHNENHKIISNSRVKSGRKPGAQIGHAPTYRKRYEPTEETIELIPAKVLEAPEKWEKMKEVRRRQVVDTKMIVICQEYEAYGYRNKESGEILFAEFPKYVVNEMNYGEGVKAMCCLLTSFCNVSIKKTHELIKNMTDGKISISTGTIASLPKQMTERTKEDINEIIGRLVKSPYLHNDATGIRINGKKWNVYVTANDKDVIYTPSKHKGVEGVKNTPLAMYTNTVIHDHDRSYYNEIFDFAHQECLAHLIRYCQNSIENEKGLNWSTKMKEHLQYMIHRYKSGGITEDEKAKMIRKYEEILEVAKKEYEKNPPTKYYPDGYNLYKRLKKYQKETLHFLDDEIPYTNNHAERLLRVCKRKSRAVVSFRSEESVHHYCNVLSVIETAQNNDENIYEVMKKNFSIH